jgi:4-amino-4-deoxy-L-arabinose transferase-like glycosyltransferase
MYLSENRYAQYSWIGVLCVALISAYFCFIAVAKTAIDGPIRGDARDYVAYAHNLKAHNIYSRTWPDPSVTHPVPDAVRSPGYPIFLSFFIDLDKQNIAIDKVAFFQAFLAVMTLVVYILLFYRFMPITWALAAGLVTAISPHLINASVYLLTETLFTFLLGAHLLILEKTLRSKNLYWALFAGILLALSLLVRPTTQYLFMVYLLVVVLKLRSTLQENWKILFCLLLPVLVATTSWSIRNAIVTGHASDSSLAAGFLQHGMYINMMYEDHPETYGYPYRFDPMNQEFEGNLGKVLENIGQHFKQEPRRYLAWFLIGKPIEFFSWNLTESVGDAFIYAPIYSPYLDKPLFRITHQIAQALHPFLMLLGIIGAFVAVFQTKKRIPAVLLSVVMFYFVGFHMIGAPFPRYSIPLRPISYGLAFFALHAFLEWAKTRYKNSKS